jgi:hypothetical protein
MLFGVNPITHSNLKVELKNLKRENAELKSINDAYQNRRNEEMATASFATDWDAMKVFSVERNFSGEPTTILGYMLSEPATHTEEQVTYKDVVREWTLHCSPAKHEELVKEFNEWKAKKK